MFAVPVVVYRGFVWTVVPGARFTITNGKIAQIDVVADPERLNQLKLAIRQNPSPS